MKVTWPLSVPTIDSTQLPHATKYVGWGFHRRTLYRFSLEGYGRICEIWNGVEAYAGEPHEVTDGPSEGGGRA